MDFTSKVVTTTTNTPAVGSDAVITVPSGEVWEVQFINAELVTSAAVASRYMNVVPFINSQNLRGRYSPYGQPASTTVYYGYGNSLPNDSSPFMLSLTQPFPKLFLGPGDQLKTSVSGLRGADQVTLIAAYVKYPSN